MSMTADDDLQRARKRRQNRLSPIWIVPLVALLIGMWLVYDNLSSRGPEITLVMGNAEGIEAGSTLIKSLNVEVGRVEQVSLSEDLSHTVISARMSPDAERMLVEDSRFWVVKPRIDREGISGLNTVLSGAYIQLQPGQSEVSARQFEVLSQPPLGGPDAQGIRLNLVSELGDSLRVGDPVSFQGFTVGRVEETHLDTDTRQMHHRLFIESPYDTLVTENTRFWAAGGVDLQLDSTGFRVKVESLEALLVGGVTFGYLEDVPQGAAVAEHTSFTLYPDEDSARQGSFNRYLEYVLLIEDSVRGLSAGAPVEFRGVRVGTVASVPWNFSAPQPDSQERFAIPVLIRIEPQRIAADSREPLDLETWQERFQNLFQLGLRASIRSGNLLTGSMYVDLNMQPVQQDSFAAASFAGHPVFPTTRSGGFSGIETQIGNLLDKLNSLDVESVLVRVDQNLAVSAEMLAEVRSLAQSFQEVLEDPATRELPENLNRTLEELQTTLQGFSPESSTYQELSQTMQSLQSLVRDLQPMARTLSEQPSALIFDRSGGADPLPRAPRQ